MLVVGIKSGFIFHIHRKKRDHFDLGMVYESHQDLVHEKEDEEPKYTMLQLRGIIVVVDTYQIIS